MSRARAAADRVKRDAYLTPPALALAICERLRDGWGLQPSLVVEPSAGRGAFVAAARAVWPGARIIAIDVDERGRSACLRAGASTFVRASWPRVARSLARSRGGPMLVVGNPPYRQAQRHIDAAREQLIAGDALVFLLRLNFLGANKRAEWWAEARDIARTDTVVPRPGFRVKKGSDATEYGVFGWRPDQRGPAIHGLPLLWRKDRGRA
jgi:hypothetical protein